MLAIEALYTVSLFFGVGEVVTLVLVVAGVYFVGQTVVEVIESLVAFVKRATAAKSEADLEAAAKHFAHAMTLGVDIVVGLLSRKLSRPGRPTVLRAKAQGGGGKKPKYQLEEETPVTNRGKKESQGGDHTYHRAPESLPGIPNAKRVPSQNQRKRWEDKDGKIYEWDYQHGDVEVYNKRGQHLGSADPETGNMTKPPVPGRTTNK